MVLAFAFSVRRGLCKPADAERMHRHLSAVGLPTRIADIPGDKPDAERLLELIAQDKKVRRGRLTFILARGIGESFMRLTSMLRMCAHSWPIKRADRWTLKTGWYCWRF